MNRSIWIALLIILPGIVVGQNKFTKIAGVVADSTDSPLPLATVVLLQASDSVMYGFTTSNKEGAFDIGRVEAGNYLLQVSFMGYASLSKKISVNTAKDIFDLGRITLQEQNTMLDGVDITADYIPIVIKQDTIEYNANAFKTQPNAVVEDLLKRLPGVEVESDGSIKAQGESVNRVLVDGKEFFGDDPKIATKNLPADAVNKVQVFDKMSEIAEFTGVDDGERDKTINLTLKEDKKNGIFGNISGGYGTEGTYNGKLNVNNFTDKLQLSILANGNNINRSSFSMGEYFSFMGGMSGMMGRGGEMIMISGSPQQSNGITDTQAAGINFNYDLSDKTEIRSSYFYNRVDNLAISNTFRENFLDGTTFNSFDSNQANSITGSHRLNFYMKHEFSKMADLIIRTDLGMGTGSMVSLATGETRNAQDQIENSSSRDQDSDGDNKKINSRVTYRQKFDKVGRSMVAEARINNTATYNGLELFSENDFKPYDVNLGFAEVINQFQEENNNQIDFGGKLSYTEPIGKKQYLEFNYSHQNYRTELDKDFYDIVDVNQILNTDLSSLYNRDYYYNRGGVTYTLTRNKFNINAGLTYQQSELKGTTDVGAEPIRKEFNQLLPMFTARYNFTTSKNLNLRYSTNLREPSLEQLQPIVNNEDPVNIYIGNPDLRAQFQHRLSLSFHSFDQFSYISLFGNLSGTYTSNKITNSRTIDEFLRQTTTPVNVDFDKGINGYISFGAPLKWMGTKINLSSNFNLSRSLLFINGIENLTDRNNTGVTLRMDNRKKEKVDWTIGTRYSFNSNKYSVNEELNQNYLRTSYFTNINLFLGKWTLSSNFNYSIYSGEAFGEEDTIPLWTGSISRSFMKADRLELKFSAFDILNQNQGISRNSQLNYIEEVQFNALARYFMFTATYNLSKFGGARAKNNIIDIKMR